MPPKRGKWPSVGANAPRGRPGTNRGGFRGFASAATPTRTASNGLGFSMRDEARNTSSHQFWAEGDTKLRQRPVTFVSAGVVEPLKDSKLPSTVEEQGDDAVADIVEATGNNTEAGDADGLEMEAAGLIKVGTPIDEEMTVKEEMTIREETTVEVVEQQTVVFKETNQPAEAESTKTKELFFFDLEGDETMQSSTIPPPRIPSPRSSFGGSDSSEEVILFRGRSTNPRGATQKNDYAHPRTQPAPSMISVYANPSPQPTLSKILVECRHEVSTVTRNVSGSRNSTRPAQPVKTRSKSQRNRSRPSKAKEENDEEDEILADYIANMAANPEDDFIAHQLESFSGYRDLGGEDDAVNLGSEDGLNLVKIDDSPADGEDESASSNISDAERDDLMNDDDHDMDADMDDETLARLLSKQEQLGIGSDELLIFPGSGANENRRGKRAAGADSNRASKGPANASQVADAFDDLDLADWVQPVPRKRRSKQPPNFNVSDSELEAALRTSWSRDRERKKTRKAERESLRAEGLLGKNIDPEALRVKYLTGMKLDDVKCEITSFLVSLDERLEFPPLDKHARKVLHELASKFNIKSQSIGKGDQRRPVIYRTLRTARYASTRVEDATRHVEEATIRIQRKYFPRLDVKGVRGSGPPRATAAGGRSGQKALMLREGEIVGASVPELGQANKGRAMLEKMGWSKGMGLGTLENKGILEPVAQVMKRSKAGLG